MDASQWPQHQVGGTARAMEEIQPQNNMNSGIMGTSTNSRGAPMVVERRARPQKEQNLNCPRCNSTNTKFCYYNNYSLTQPRYFCKTCRRYWTQGGSLRNVPVGGGSRKNKRSSCSSPSILGSSAVSNASSTPTIHTKLIPDLNPPNTLPHLITAGPRNPSKFLEAQDLNLAFPIQGIFHHPNGNETHEAINGVNGDITTSTPPTTSTTASCGGGISAPISALELLRTGIASRGSLNSYLPMPIPDPNSPLYPSGLPGNLQEFKPNVGVFSSSHGGDHGNNNSNEIGGNNTSARLLFPFADMNKLASSAKTAHHPEIDDQSRGGHDHHHNHHQHHNHHHHHHHHHHHQGPTGYWTGMLGGGAW